MSISLPPAPADASMAPGSAVWKDFTNFKMRKKLNARPAKKNEQEGLLVVWLDTWSPTS